MLFKRTLHLGAAMLAVLSLGAMQKHLSTTALADGPPSVNPNGELEGNDNALQKARDDQTILAIGKTDPGENARDQIDFYAEIGAQNAMTDQTTLKMPDGPTGWRKEVADFRHSVGAAVREYAIRSGLFPNILGAGAITV